MTAIPSNESLITMLEPDSAAAEAYKILRTNISLRDFDHPLQVINVISSNAQESKSTTVLNLAYAFAQLNKKVLVVDLDLRMPSLHKKLKLKNKIGITDLVAKRATKEEVTIHYVKNLDIILSGTKIPFSSEFVQSNSFKKTLEDLRKDYKMIFLDCPPVGLVTDGVIASTMCDGTIMCVAKNADNTCKRND